MENVDEYGIMMPIKLTIVGNGFDLALEARTGYDTFYQCLKECFESECLDDFKSAYLHEGNEKLVERFYSIVQQNRENFFINYFLNYKTVFGNWVAFEKELTKIIKSFDNLVSYLNSSDRLLVYRTSVGDVDVFVQLYDDRTLVQVLDVYRDNKFFFTDLKSRQFGDKYYTCFEFKEGKYENAYAFYNFVESFSQDFPKELFKDLTIFSNLFSLYLWIVDHYAQLDRRLNDVTGQSYFINYNFTGYLEKITGVNASDFGKVIYINGLVKNMDGAIVENIVFGIDSNTQLKNNQFEIFTKRIQRSLKETDIDRLEEVLSEKINEIDVIGHSLNLADYESLGFIFSKADRWGPKIIIYCLDEDAKIDLVINLKQILGRDVFDKYQREGLLKFVDSKKAWVK